MFVVLGLKNAWRNRGRTALGIVSMAIAAVIFMSSSTLSKGYPAGAFWRARQLIGGEIVMLPEKTSVSTDTLSGGGYIWEFERKSFDRPTQILGFDPTAYWYGAMNGVPTSGAPVLVDRLNEVALQLKTESFVNSVSVKKSIPFLAPANDKQGDYYMYGFIEPRDLSLDARTYRIAESVSRGRYLEPGDLMKGVACGKWQNLILGTKANIEIPSARQDSLTGVTFYNYENPVTVKLEIVGQATFQEPDPGSPVYSNPVVMVTPETFEALRSASGIADSSATWGITLSIGNMSELENYVALLRRQYPDFTVYAAPQLATAAGNREAVASGVPMDMRRVTETLSFMVAALLSATNLSVLMMARKNEIGILRAIGATRGNIASMVLAESIWIALLGSLIGGLFTQPAILWQLLSNKVDSHVVAATVGANMAKALGFSVAAAVAFGFLPIAKALRVTPAQVLRGE